MGRWIPHPDWTLTKDHGVPVEYSVSEAEVLVDRLNSRPDRFCDYRIRDLHDNPWVVYIEFRDRPDRRDNHGPDYDYAAETNP